MASKRVTINHNSYELITPKTNEFYHLCYGKTLEMCYDCPSKAKQSIYDFWYNTMCELNKVLNISYNSLGISSYNCNFFTYQCEFDLQGRYILQFVITYAHNRLYIYDEELEKYLNYDETIELLYKAGVIL